MLALSKARRAVSRLFRRTPKVAAPQLPAALAARPRRSRRAAMAGLAGMAGVAGFGAAMERANALSVPAVLLYDQVTNVKNFGAKGDGTTDDTAAIQAALNAAAASGTCLVFFPASLAYMISSSLSIPLGVSCIGVSRGNDIQGPAASIIRATASFPVTSTMLVFANAWSGRFENLVIDGNNYACSAIAQSDTRGATHRNILITNIAYNASGGNFGWYCYTNSVSFAGNLYEQITIDQYYMAANVNGFIGTGTNTGSSATYSFTENTFHGCDFGSDSNASAFILAAACDNNYFFGCGFSTQGSAPNGALQLNDTSISTVGENYCFGCTFVAGSGYGVVSKYNYAHNSFFGCYFLGSPAYYIGTNGLLNFRSCPINDLLVQPSSTLSPGGSPWTYTNNNPFPVQFMFWGGGVSAISFVRNGTPGGLGVSTGDFFNFVLEPNDGMKITYTSTITAVAYPMA